MKSLKFIIFRINNANSTRIYLAIVQMHKKASEFILPSHIWNQFSQILPVFYACRRMWSFFSFPDSVIQTLTMLQNIFFLWNDRTDILWKRILKYFTIVPIFKSGLYEESCIWWKSAIFFLGMICKDQAFWKLIRYKNRVFNSQLNWCTIWLTWSGGHTDLGTVYIKRQ